MIRRSLTALAAGLLLASSAHATAIFQNGDFSVTNAAYGSALYSGWNTTPVTAAGWTFGAGSGIINHNWDGEAALGTVAFLQSYSPFGWASPTISQTFSVSGNINISFQLAQRTNNTESVNVTFDGAALAPTITPVGSTFTTYTFALSGLLAGNHTLSFSGINNFASTTPDNSLFIDNVSVSARAAVPEPASAALMLTGLGLLGVVSRRRKNRSAA